MDFDIYSPSIWSPDDAAEPYSDIVSAHRPNAGLRLAHTTLTAGCAFIAARPDQGDIAGPVHPARLRMLGNRLHELDRFLSVLIDEAAALSAKPRREERFFANMRNTPEKLRRLGGQVANYEQAGERLRAIGRICAYLRHCGEDIDRPELVSDFLVAAGADELLRGKDAPLMVSIALFYRSVGDRLIASVENPAR